VNDEELVFAVPKSVGFDETGALQIPDMLHDSSTLYSQRVANALSTGRWSAIVALNEI
jgi:hypothetical protein